MSGTYNELEGAQFEASFEDEGEPTAPATVHYKLACLTTETTLIDWTLANVLSETDDFGNITRYYVTINIPGSANAIQKSANKREQKQLIIVANKDEDNEFNLATQYYVLNTQRA
jgi:hypothetical protein